ncbi:MAG: Trp biosynthesis-associated membrane protein [Actinomycetota bacterium]
MTETDQATLRLRTAGFLISVLGGFLVALGSLLPWAEVDFGGIATTVGIDLGDGLITLVAGAVMVISVLAMRVGKTSRARRGLGVVVIAGGLAAVSIGVGALLGNKDKFALPAVEVKLEQVAEQTGLPLERLKEQLAEQLEVIEVQPGIYVVIAGGAIGIIGGLLSLKWASRWKGSEPAG